MIRDECNLVFGAGGGDDVRPACLEELDGDDPDAAGGARDQHRLAALWLDSFNRVVSGRQ